MKIFSVDVDVEKYQWAMPADDSRPDYLDLMTFECRKKKDLWIDQDWFVFNPKLEEGDFYFIDSGVLAFSEKVHDSDLGSLIAMAGEVLPIRIGGKSAYILNVLECCNALNEKETIWNVDNPESPLLIEKYAFYEDRITESTIFKIPQTAAVRVLTYCDVKDPEDEFYYLYQSLGFTGLEFECLYSSESVRLG